MKRAIAIAIAMLYVAACSKSPTAPSSGTITYSITGTARHVSITYESSRGGGSQTSAAVPWTFSRLAQRGDFLYVSAQIDQGSDRGSILVQILFNGQALFSGTADGFPSIGSASGTF